MEGKMISFETGEKNGWTIWSIIGRLDRITAPEAGAEADKIFAASRKLAIDLYALDYLSSAGIRVLLRLAKAAKPEGKAFALFAPGGMVKSVLVDSRMEMFVNIYESADELP